jgi:hypothetical protein
VLLISLSPFRGYAVEARSYAAGWFSNTAAVLSQRMDVRRFMTPLFAVSLLVLSLVTRLRCNNFNPRHGRADVDVLITSNPMGVLDGLPVCDRPVFPEPSIAS